MGVWKVPNLTLQNQKYPPSNNKNKNKDNNNHILILKMG